MEMPQARHLEHFHKNQKVSQSNQWALISSSLKERVQEARQWTPIGPAPPKTKMLPCWAHQVDKLLSDKNGISIYNRDCAAGKSAFRRFLRKGHAIEGLNRIEEIQVFV